MQHREVSTADYIKELTIKANRDTFADCCTIRLTNNIVDIRGYGARDVIEIINQDKSIHHTVVFDCAEISYIDKNWLIKVRDGIRRNDITMYDNHTGKSYMYRHTTKFILINHTKQMAKELGAPELYCRAEKVII